MISVFFVWSVTLQCQTKPETVVSGSVTYRYIPTARIDHLIPQIPIWKQPSDNPIQTAVPRDNTTSLPSREKEHPPISHLQATVLQGIKCLSHTYSVNSHLTATYSLAFSKSFIPLHYRHSVPLHKEWQYRNIRANSWGWHSDRLPTGGHLTAYGKTASVPPANGRLAG